MAQAGAQPHCLIVFDTAILNIEAKEPATVALRVPAQVILYIVPCKFAWVLYLATQPAFQFVTEPRDAALLHNIFHACMLAIIAVAIVALDGDNGLRYFQHFVNRGKAERRSESGTRL